ncbi:uncharacterized protein EV420DRAFT_1538342 [Desarmillaria tabescens]|uniref:Uncharacterized protein n=1 Tax=Armillaria tabescens TaxID=1929756 RepID=A0AA39N6D3_ARMTA|nr:uncharacterized protein EV420DRAFT_1538342 [Desarmillaria tabescens]KAK0459109.1 hypothetical protein EV420DRAFT_1538342 [Desarmillaria tabescens]
MQLERVSEIAMVVVTAAVLNILTDSFTLSKASKDAIRRAFIVQPLVIILANIRIPDSAPVVPFAWFHIFHLILWIYVLMPPSTPAGVFAPVLLTHLLWTLAIRQNSLFTTGSYGAVFRASVYAFYSMVHGIILLTMHDETLTEQWSRIALPPRIAPFICFLYIPVEVFWTWSKNIGRALLNRPLIGDTEDLIWLRLLHGCEGMRNPANFLPVSASLFSNPLANASVNQPLRRQTQPDLDSQV